MAHGSNRAIRLSAELRDDATRDRAIKEIAAAFRKAEGNATHAAEALDTAHVTLMKWVREFPALEKVVREIRARHDHPHEVGQPHRRR